MNDALLRRIGKDSIVSFKPSAQAMFDVDIVTDADELWLARFIRRDERFEYDINLLDDEPQCVGIVCAVMPIQYDDSKITNKFLYDRLKSPAIITEEFFFKYKNFDKTEIIIPSVIKVSPPEMYVTIPGVLELMELDIEKI